MNRIEWDIFHVAEVIVALFLWLFPAFLASGGITLEGMGFGLWLLEGGY